MLLAGLGSIVFAIIRTRSEATYRVTQI